MKNSIMGYNVLDLLYNMGYIIYRLYSLTDTGENVPKVDASIFDSALSHTRRSDASEKNRRK